MLIKKDLDYFLSQIKKTKYVSQANFYFSSSKWEEWEWIIWHYWDKSNPLDYGVFYWKYSYLLVSKNWNKKIRNTRLIKTKKELLKELLRISKNYL